MDPANAMKTSSPAPEGLLVQDFLETTASRLPAKVALVCAGRRFTYAGLETMANRLAGALQAMGVRRGDRVAICLSNCAESVAAIFAALKAGAVFVAINQSTKFDKLVYILNNCRAKALLAEARMEDLADRVVESVPSLVGIVLCGRRAGGRESSRDWCHGFDDIQNQFPDVRPPRVAVSQDLACLIYTSGTTGEPKGVVCDHSNMTFASNSVIQYLENVEGDVILNVLPLSFSYGLYQALMAFKFGGTIVLENSFAYPAVILKLMEQERVTGFPGVPTIFSSLLRQDLSRYNLSNLRYFTNAAAALAVPLIREIRRRFPSTAFYSMYGQTETKRTLYLPPDQIDQRPDSVGIAIPGTEAWIEDEAGNRLGPGQAGELFVRGPHVMRGYWEAPEATALRFHPGANPDERICRTGDLFRMDEQGYFYFVSRQDDIIKCRGEKVAPKEVENVLYALKGVVEAAVVGIPDPILGQAIKAVIVPNGAPLSAAQVLAHCRLHLDDGMVPQHVEFRTELPRTASGKVKRAELI